MINIDDEIKKAMLNHSPEVNVLRLIKAEILKFKTAKNAKEYDDAAEIQLLRKMAKQREEAIEMYANAGRIDLVDKERFELDTINMYIPESPSKDSIKEYLENTIDVSTLTKKDMGKTIKMLKEQFPTADGSIISDIVKAYVV